MMVIDSHHHHHYLEAGMAQNLKSQPFPSWIQKEISVTLSPTSHQYRLIQYHFTPFCPF